MGHASQQSLALQIGELSADRGLVEAVLVGKAGRVRLRSTVDVDEDRRGDKRQAEGTRLNFRAAREHDESSLDLVERVVVGRHTLNMGLHSATVKVVPCNRTSCLVHL